MSLVSKILSLLGLHRGVESPQSSISPDSTMNEGDYRSGPGGYTPAGYSDTFYGGAEYLYGDDDNEGNYR
jgi:hypothetical protein